MMWTTFLLFVAATSSGVEPPDAPSLIDLKPRGRSLWQEKRLNRASTRFITILEDGRPALMTQSHDSASALWRPLGVPVTESTTLNWRWRVTRALPENTRERGREGDDYAARLLIGFGPSPFSKSSPALCYVWASTEPVGAIYPSPYLENVVTLVVESGNGRLGEWVMETRNILEDYERAFGEDPDTLYHLAVMTDTDDTGARATAWFSDIRVAPPQQ